MTHFSECTPQESLNCYLLLYETFDQEEVLLSGISKTEGKIEAPEKETEFPVWLFKDNLM